MIDGVIFQFEEGGKKLTRIGGESLTIGVLLTFKSWTLPMADQPRPLLKAPQLDKASSTAASATAAPSAATLCRERRVLQHSSTTFTDSSLNAKRAEQAKKPCRYYTKTGACRRSLVGRSPGHEYLSYRPILTSNSRPLCSRFDMPLSAHP